MAIWKRKSDTRLPELKWDVEIGCFLTETRTNTEGVGWENIQANIANDKFRGVFDLPNLLGGWVAYLKNVGRDTAMVPLSQSDYGPRPSSDHQQGLRLLVKLDESLGGVICEFLTTLRGAWDEIDKLHDAYLAKIKEHKEHEGHLPAVDVGEIRKESLRDNKTLLIPTFKIVGMVARPFDLPVGGIPILNPSTKKKADAQASGGNSAKAYERPKPPNEGYTDADGVYHPPF
jgi:hypothetical protein